MLTSTAAISPIRQPDQPDLTAVKARQQGAWSAGDYGIVGTTLQIVGESLCEAIDLRAGSRVLDVAAGNGNASLAAARRFCDVVSTDYVPALLELGRKRAEGERLSLQFREADAERLPFADAEFDAVLSTFGVMFTPDQDRAAGEMLRVCRPGGKIGLANWTPDSFIGQLFRVLGKHIPPPPGVKSPSLWGTEARLGELFPSRAASISAQQAAVRLPLPLAGPLARGLSHLLWARAQGLRRAQAGAAGRARGRYDGADAAAEPLGRPDSRPAQRLFGSRHHQTLDRPAVARLPRHPGCRATVAMSAKPTGGRSSDRARLPFQKLIERKEASAFALRRPNRRNLPVLKRDRPDIPSVRKK